MENTLIITPVVRPAHRLHLVMIPAVLAICQALRPAAVAAESASETVLRALPALPRGEGDSDNEAGKSPGKAALTADAGPGDYVHWNSWARAGATENEFSFGGELLAPLWHDPRSVLFLYPKVSALEAGRQSYSLGAGGRVQLDSVPLILGANFFYDHSEGFANHHFDQLGAGVEMLSDWWEFRANGYLNLSDQRLIDSVRTQESSSTTRQTGSSSQYLNSGPQYATGHSIVQQDYYRQVQTYQTITTNTTRVWENFAQPMSGLDAEFGVLLPGLPKHNIEARAFLGGYYYFNPYGGKDLTGVKARAEVRFFDRLYLDGAWTQDAEVMGGNWYAGIRVNVPFGAKPETAVRGSNGLHALSHRLVEAVQRNTRPVLAQSGYRENFSEREVVRAIQIRKAIRVVANTQVVQDHIDFVDNTPAKKDGPPPTGNGTAEQPYGSIVAAAADAAQRYYATGHAYTVLVKPTAWAYTGNVLITAPMHITGSPNCGGILHADLPDQRTGGNPNYTTGFTDALSLVFGGFTAQNVAGKVEIDGFNIRYGGAAGDGIQMTNVAQSVIRCNNISVPGNGVHIVNYGAVNHTLIADNILQENGRNGIRLHAENGGQFTGLISGNDGSRNLGHGLELNLTGEVQTNDKLKVVFPGSSWQGNLENNRFSNNGGDGFHYAGAGHLNGSLLDNYFNENQGIAGIALYNSGHGLVTLGVAYNDAHNNVGGGIYVSGEHSSLTIVPTFSNNFHANGTFGYRANLKDDATLGGDVQDNDLASNHLSGLEFSLGNHSQMNVSLLHNDAHSNGTDGFVGFLDGGSFTGNISNNTLDGNGRHGLFVLTPPAGYTSVMSGNINNNLMNDNGGSGLQVELSAGNFSSSLFSNIVERNQNGLAFDTNFSTLNLDVHHNQTNHNVNSGISIRAHDGSQIWGPGVVENTLVANHETSSAPAAALDIEVRDSTWNAGDVRGNQIAGGTAIGLSVDLVGTTTWHGDVTGNSIYGTGNSLFGNPGLLLGIANSGGTQLNLTHNVANRNGSTVSSGGPSGIYILTDNHPAPWVGNITGNASNENFGPGFTWQTTLTGDLTFTGDFQNNTSSDNQASGFHIISGPASVTIGGGTQTGGNSSLNNGAGDVFSGGFGL